MIKKYIYLYIFTFSLLHATGAWMINGRPHPELKWKTIVTKNFDVHYHEKIFDIALKGASIAEQIRPTLMKQMGIKKLKRLDIVFTSEDEILNGFAMPSNNTIIWVDQNDAALWAGDEKWLRTVIAHELQHLVFFNAINTWLPEPMNSFYSNNPGWIVEGLAEYFTEKWRPFRFDISHKKHLIENKLHKIQDPHNDGFSKSLYLADRFGDSTITNIFNDRNKLQLFNFSSSFYKYTGLTLKQFNEQWRIHISTYYYGIRSQKERIQDIGEYYQLPVHNVLAFDYFPDSMKIALVGRLNKNQKDYSLIIATRDTVAEKKERQKEIKKSKIVTSRLTSRWELHELDYGVFGQLSIQIDVSHDGKSILYTKYNRNKNQSIIFDIWKVDVKSRKKEKLTRNMRASHPSFSPDNQQFVFVAHDNSTTQLYKMDLKNKNIIKLSNNKGDTQILNPKWSYDKNFIAYAQSDQDGHLDIHILDLKSGRVKQITDTPEADYYPIWHPNNKDISFTGFYNNTPNLYTFNIYNKELIQNTDVGDIIIGHKWNKNKSTITAFTLDTGEFPFVVDIKPNRIANVKETRINSAYSSWLKKTPDYPIKNIDQNKPAKIISKSNYRFYKHLTHVGTLILPDAESLIYQSAFSDAVGRHLLSFSYLTDYDSTNSILFQYQNSIGVPFRGFWGFNYFRDINFQFQIYNIDQMPLVEIFDGVSFWFKLPYNFGRSISSNHLFTSALQFWDRKVILSESYEKDIFDYPAGGKEGTFFLSYRFLNKRPNKVNSYAPYQGTGLEISTKQINKSIWGDRSYSKFGADAFFNKKIDLLAFYFRFRYEQLSGSYPPQEQLGLVNIPNYYFAGQYVPGREYMSPRGWDSVRLGEKAFMGTAELRLPVLPINIFELLRTVKLGQPTFAIISDFGNAWNDFKFLGPSIVTAGLEFRFSILLADISFITISYGLAQSLDEWGNSFKNYIDQNKQIFSSASPYFRLVLINPF